MSSDKQISEMAKVMCTDCADYGDCKYNGACDCILACAKTLYNAGYRKSTDVAEEIFAEIKHIGGCSDGVRLNWWDIAELEKKYKEGGECKSK